MVRHQNLYLLQVRQIIRDGGPWASAVLQGILREAPQPPDEGKVAVGSVCNGVWRHVEGCGGGVVVCGGVWRGVEVV